MTTSRSLQRRSLVFHNLDDAVRDAEMLLERGYDRVGNWTLSQCCSHLSDWLRFPVEGFPRQPAPVRAIFWMMRHAFGKRMLARWLADGSMPAGKPTMPQTVAKSPGNDAEAVVRFRNGSSDFSHMAGLIIRRRYSAKSTGRPRPNCN